MLDIGGCHRDAFYLCCFINFISIDAVFYSALIQRDQEKSSR